MEVHLNELSPTSGDVQTPHPHARIDVLRVGPLLQPSDDLYEFSGATVKICGDHITIRVGKGHNNRRSSVGVLVIMNWVSGAEIMVSIQIVESDHLSESIGQRLRV